MIDYKSYKEIINYLNKNELNELREYLNQEINKSYLTRAKKQLQYYLNGNPMSFYGYLNDNKIIISNSFSAYILESDEILSKYMIQRFKSVDEEVFKNDIALANSFFEKYDSNNLIKADDGYKLDKKNNVLLSNEEYKITHNFSASNYLYSKYFLGEDSIYLLDKNKTICLVNSNKGKGFVLGIRK